MRRHNTTYHFSEKSLAQLETCDKRLQMLAWRVIDIIDFTVMEGRRSKERQNLLFKQGKSKVQWPDGKHNVEDPEQLSMAFDIAPYPVDWDDLSSFYYLGGIVKAVAHEMGIKIRWGGDWDSDNDLNDQHFNDLVHFEIQGWQT